MRLAALPFAILLVSLPALHAQSFTTSACSGGDEGSSRSGFASLSTGSGSRACEIRRTTIPTDGKFVGVSGENGGIEVVGEDRRDIALEARVVAQGSNQDEAAALLHRIEISTNGTIHASGPQMSGWARHGWSVSYKLRVPRQAAAKLHTANGSITATDVNGGSQIDTVNGGLTLRNLSGSVEASTVNGSIEVEAAGNEWHGSGLTAKTVNGAIAFKAPEGYSAHLVVHTTNGGIAVAFPVTTGETKRNSLDTNLGHGGPTLQFSTVNGSVAIGRQ